MKGYIHCHNHPHHRNIVNHCKAKKKEPDLRKELKTVYPTVHTLQTKLLFLKPFTDNANENKTKQQSVVGVSLPPLLLHPG